MMKINQAQIVNGMLAFVAGMIAWNLIEPQIQKITKK